MKKSSIFGVRANGKCYWRRKLWTESCQNNKGVGAAVSGEKEGKKEICFSEPHPGDSPPGNRREGRTGSLACYSPQGRKVGQDLTRMITTIKMVSVVPPIFGGYHQGLETLPFCLWSLERHNIEFNSRLFYILWQRTDLRTCALWNPPLNAEFLDTNLTSSHQITHLPFKDMPILFPYKYTQRKKKSFFFLLLLVTRWRAGNYSVCI